MARLVLSLPVPLRRHSLWLLALVLGLAALGSWWAYEDIPLVHFHLLIAWAKAYDTVLPHPDILPTPMEGLVIASFSVPTPLAVATAQPGLRPTASIIPAPLATGVATSSPPPPTPVPPPLPEAVLLQGIRHEQQYFNNCGPTTLAMALSFWGWQGDQHVIRPYLRPNKDDKNVSPEEMPAYLTTHGFEAVVRVNGDVETLKRFLAAGYPVIVEKGLICQAGADRCEGWVGHYALVVGYADARQRLLLDDSFLGAGLELTYADMLADWRPFNYVYVVVFPTGAERRAQVLALLGTAADVERNYQAALARAESEAANSKWMPAAFAWFNAGSNLTALGDYAGAAAAYDQARHEGIPYNMLWYQFGPYQAYAAVGRYADVEHLASFAISSAHLSGVEEAYYWRGRAREVLGFPDQALADYHSALEYNLNFRPAQAALLALRQMR